MHYELFRKAFKINVELHSFFIAGSYSRIFVI